MALDLKRFTLGRQLLLAVSVLAAPFSAFADEEPESASADKVAEERGFAGAAVSAVMQFVRPASEPPVTLSPALRLEAFPALQANEDTLRLLDVSYEPVLMSRGFNAIPGKQGLDLNSSYVWESPRFGQFVLSTNTSYLYNPVSPAAARESSLLGARAEGVASSIALMPERQSSLTFSWQIGNHTATAVTSYSGALDQLGLLSLENLNVDDLNELVGQITTLDLSYGYNVRAGRQGNASISLGVRNMLDSRLQSPAVTRRSNAVEPAGSVAYGTIKYQF
ncbi:hypothetical protein E3V39_03220 [Gammaproteobacteria bacterium LSUCC0112]|nr:hypothetical protein E3V39_03220 [Gammaproteobacteria bacterium LSUCC0112]